MTKKFLLAAAVSLALSIPAMAEDSPFHAGTLIPEYGKIATVESDMPIPRGTVFKIAFDGTARADRGGINRTLDAAVRFLNMHAAAGVPAKDMHLAIVFHGPAVFDLTRPEAYARNAPAGAVQVVNANAPLIAILLRHNVDFYACGQSAASLGIAKSDLLPGVKMSLSAMTAHALLQQSGYTLNPF